MKPILFLLLASAGAFLTASGPCLADTAPRYRLTVLPLSFQTFDEMNYATLPGGRINNAGQIAGEVTGGSSRLGDYRVAIWQMGRPLRLLDKTPVARHLRTEDGSNRDYTFSTAINARGEVVGGNYLTFSGAYSGTISTAYIWAGGRMKKIGGFPDECDGLAFGLNERGEVVGGYHYNKQMPTVDEASPPPIAAGSHAFLFHDGHVLPLWHGIARGINNEGEIVGTQASGSYDKSRDKGVLWRKGQITLLKMQPVAINERGEVAGNIPLTEDSGRACVWRRGQTIRLSKQTSHAYALNNRGEVVGETNSPAFSHTFRAALWRRGRTYDLNRCVSLPPGWTLNSAIGINDRGRIIGMGSASKTTSGKQSTRTFTFLLTPQ